MSERCLPLFTHQEFQEVFEETRLPPKEAFKNDLTGDAITEEKYEFAQVLCFCVVVRLGRHLQRFSSFLLTRVLSRTLLDNFRPLLVHTG